MYAKKLNLSILVLKSITNFSVLKRKIILMTKNILIHETKILIYNKLIIITINFQILNKGKFCEQDASLSLSIIQIKLKIRGRTQQVTSFSNPSQQ